VRRADRRPRRSERGSEQEYGEDCPVCCVPLLLRVLVDPDGEIAIDARSE
jgi:hypothetical protein